MAPDVQYYKENIKSTDSTASFTDTMLRTSNWMGLKSIWRIWPDIKSAGILYKMIKEELTAKISE